jgi:flavin reductase (DIM6/NTAB) family NADH-FMN oxidoreductase RutF
MPPELLRRTLGRFCTGVTIVSTELDGEIHAMTANSFTSVSLDPPLILVSIDRRARMHALLPERGRFCVSVLAREQEDTAWHFAGRPCLEGDDVFDEDGLVRGAIARLECRLYAAHEAGDHTLYLGLVEDLDSRPGEPLLFHDGAFSTR